MSISYWSSADEGDLSPITFSPPPLTPTLTLCAPPPRTLASSIHPHPLTSPPHHFTSLPPPSILTPSPLHSLASSLHPHPFTSPLTASLPISLAFSLHPHPFTSSLTSHSLIPSHPHFLHTLHPGPHKHSTSCMLTHMTCHHIFTFLHLPTLHILSSRAHTSSHTSHLNSHTLPSPPHSGH